jgi:hypothetical protein
MSCEDNALSRQATVEKWRSGCVRLVKVYRYNKGENVMYIKLARVCDLRRSVVGWVSAA